MIESHFAKSDAPGATPPATETDPTRFQYLWEPPQTPVSVRLSADLIARLEKESLDIFRAITNRGSEIGGLLLGYVLSRTPLLVLVEDYEPFPCGFALGPTFRLSPEEIDKLGEAVARRKGSSGLIAVGFFRSNTRPTCALSDDDLALFDKLFPEEHNIFALAKPYSRKPCVGAIFVREQGRIRGEASYLEFPFSKAELEKTGALQPALRVVAAPGAAPAPPPQPQPEVKAEPKPAPPPRIEPMARPSVPPVMVSVQPAFRRVEVPPPPPPPPPPVAPPPKVETKPIVETRAIVTPVTPSLRRQESPAATPPAPTSRPIVPVARPAFTQRTIARPEAPKPEPKPAPPPPEPVAVAPARPEPIPEPRIEPTVPPEPEPAPKAARPAFVEVKKPSETEPAPAPTEFSFHYGTEPESHGKRWLILIALAVVVVAAILGYRFYSGAKSTPVSAIPPAPPVALTLSVEGADKGVAIRWDGLNPALSSAASGKLTIRDGGVPTDFDLTADQLKEGVYKYKPRSDDLSVRLEAGRAVGATRILGATRLKKVGGR